MFVYNLDRCFFRKLTSLKPHDLNEKGSLDSMVSHLSYASPSIPISRPCMKSSWHLSLCQIPQNAAKDRRRTLPTPITGRTEKEAKWIDFPKLHISELSPFPTGTWAFMVSLSKQRNICSQEIISYQGFTANSDY